MARTRRQNAEEAWQDVAAAAERLVRLRPNTQVVIASGRLEVIRAAPPAPTPEGVSAYDAAILAALTERPQIARRIARAAGHTFNSYFRERLALLTETGRVRRTRRGYSRA